MIWINTLTKVLRMLENHKEMPTLWKLQTFRKNLVNFAGNGKLWWNMWHLWALELINARTSNTDWESIVPTRAPHCNVMRKLALGTRRMWFFMKYFTHLYYTVQECQQMRRNKRNTSTATPTAAYRSYGWRRDIINSPCVTNTRRNGRVI